MNKIDIAYVCSTSTEPRSSRGCKPNEIIRRSMRSNIFQVWNIILAHIYRGSFRPIQAHRSFNFESAGKQCTHSHTGARIRLSTLSWCRARLLLFKYTHNRPHGTRTTYRRTIGIGKCSPFSSLEYIKRLRRLICYVCEYMVVWNGANPTDMKYNMSEANIQRKHINRCAP